VGQGQIQYGFFYLDISMLGPDEVLAIFWILSTHYHEARHAQASYLQLSSALTVTATAAISHQP